VVVVADDKDLFWIAEVTDADDEKVALRYYHYTINRNDEKIYKLCLPLWFLKVIDFLNNNL
jgi:hypothetical protein